MNLLDEGSDTAFIAIDDSEKLCRFAMLRLEPRSSRRRKRRSGAGRKGRQPRGASNQQI